MSKRGIAKMLKAYRNRCKFSVDEVIIKLKQKGIEISAKTLYGYENSVSRPDVDTFMALCSFYDIKNFNEFDIDNNLISYNTVIPADSILFDKLNRLDTEDIGKAESYIDWLLSSPKYEIAAGKKEA